ncbi:hypothetical protein [Halorubrum distributum]|uniref:Pentapeptide repeat-containing protein n=1 Tax=Halorubrum distributum TaxID=29283 RepID=A0A6B1IRP1_9EURY|nr:hypothetical protein [Halorubrum terrestre]MYL69124.1 hypothetical protein [Halorubrum terrestre]
MTGTCDYFDSERWDRRKRSFVRRIPVAELLELHPEVEDPNGTRTAIAEEMGFEYADRIDSLTLPEVVDDAGECLPTVDPDDWFDVWRRHGTSEAYPERCERTPVADDRCALHLPPDHEERTRSGERLLRRSLEAGHDLIGARFGELSLDYATVARSDARPVDLRHAEFTRLDATHAEFENAVHLDGGDATSVQFADATVDATLRAPGFEIEDTFDGTDLRAHGRRVDLRWVTADEVVFEKAVIAGEFDATASRCQTGNWKQLRVGGRAVFDRMTVDERATIRRADFRGESVSFRRAVFGGDADFDSVSVAGNASWRRIRVDGIFDCSGTEVAGNANFSKATFAGRRSLFAETAIDGTADFGSAAFASGPRFHAADLDEVMWVKTEADGPIDCKNATVSDGTLIQPSDGATEYDFTGATLGTLTLTSPDGDIGTLDHCRIYNTTFDGFPFDRHSGQTDGHVRLHEYSSRNHDGDDPVPDLISTYLKAKNGAEQVGAAAVASTFFLQEMKYRRRKHRDSLYDSTGSTASALVDLGANWTYALTMGYGERPLRTVGFSLFVVFGYANLFFLAGLGETYSNSLNLSFQAFVSLLLGTPAIGDATLHELLVASEAFFGAFCIALFVFTLTRSVRR